MQGMVDPICKCPITRRDRTRDRAAIKRQLSHPRELSPAQTQVQAALRERLAR